MSEERFGPYRLEGLIGRGGMGEVYRAFDVVKKRAVAVKRLPSPLVADVEFQARFRRESELVARLVDPHVVPVYDYGEIDGQLFIEMRLVEGADLAKLLASTGPLLPDRTVEIISQVAGALDSAHAVGLVHRDVKPSNVLITRRTNGEEFVYLSDFGIARALAGATSLTMTGATVGTLAYMAPERFTGQGDDLRIDVYALACLLYECLTGRPPFTGEGLPALMYAHLNLEPPKPSEHQSDVPADLDAVINCGMAKQPEHRYPSAGALAAAARAALTGTGAVARPADDDLHRRASAPTVIPLCSPPPVIPLPKPRPARTRPPRRQPRMALVAAALVVALIGAGVIFLRSESPQPSSADPSSLYATPPSSTTQKVSRANAVIQTIAVDGRGGLAISPDGRNIYVANVANYNEGENGFVSVVNTAAGTVVKKLSDVGFRPVSMEASRDGRRLYVGTTYGSELYVIDTSSNAVISKIPAKPLAVPGTWGANNIAVGPDGRVYVGTSRVQLSK